MNDATLDMIRQLKKAVICLSAVDRMLEGEAEMNAAKHLSEELLPNPLATKVSSTLADIERSIERYEGVATDG